MSSVLVHGAGSGPWVWDGWDGVAVDLQAGLEVGRASMRDYAAAVARACPEPDAIVGWSMGGLVAMLAALELRPRRLALLEPSPPAEVQGTDDAVDPEPGAFDPEHVYGAFPPGVAARPESSFARAERRRGVSVPSLPCAALVVSGREFPAERGSDVAARYGCEHLAFPGLSHWELVRDARVRDAVESWIG